MRFHTVLPISLFKSALTKHVIFVYAPPNRIRNFVPDVISTRFGIKNTGPTLRLCGRVIPTIFALAKDRSNVPVQSYNCFDICLADRAFIISECESFSGVHFGELLDAVVMDAVG